MNKNSQDSWRTWSLFTEGRGEDPAFLCFYFLIGKMGTFPFGLLILSL